jgi:uncharacterized HhH-GPD family protein
MDFSNTFGQRALDIVHDERVSYDRLNMPVSEQANELLTNNPFALVIALILDQQIPLERAFAAPLELQDRLGKKLTVKLINSLAPEDVIAAFVAKPALHRFPAANAERVMKAAAIIRDEYKSKAEAVWTSATNGSQLLEQVVALPGFGIQKAKIFVALLGKQMAVRPSGWQEACAPFGDDGTTMSIADIVDDDTLQRVRAWKQAKKAAAKGDAG